MINRYVRVIPIILLIGVFSGCGSTKEAETTTPPAADADNTARNERDKSSMAVTPPDQGENEADLAITSKIRQAIVDDNALSVNAHNVKVITNAGVVTLRGPVKSQTEKTTIETKAKQVAGVTRIDNQLEVEAVN
jgi:hyperosmotically inducible periplasmic protein